MDDHFSQKPLLIILPGWGGTRETWAEFVLLSEVYYEVVVIELPCFGNEPCPSQVWGVEEYADFVKLKIVDLTSNLQKIQKVIILGHSFGGQVAACLVSTNPTICDKLILSGPAIFRRRSSLKQIIVWPIAKLGKLVMEFPGLRQYGTPIKKIFYRLLDSPDYLETSGIKRAIFKKITKQNVVHYVSRITIPTLVVAGKQDTFVSYRLSKRVANILPQGNFALIENGGHGLHQNNKDQMLTIIQRFIKQ